jgi:hypothetical protein
VPILTTQAGHGGLAVLVSITEMIVHMSWITHGRDLYTRMEQGGERT